MEPVIITEEIYDIIKVYRTMSEDIGLTPLIKTFEGKDRLDKNVVKLREFFKENVMLYAQALTGHYVVMPSAQEKLLRELEFAKEKLQKAIDNNVTKDVEYYNGFIVGVEAAIVICKGGDLWKPWG